MTAARYARPPKFDRLTRPDASRAETEMHYCLGPYDEAIRAADGVSGCCFVWEVIGLSGQGSAANTTPTLTIVDRRRVTDMAENQHICSIDGCGKQAYLRTWCNGHYLRWRRHGDPRGGGTATGVPLIWIKDMVQRVHTECVEWPFAKNGNGYGWAYYDGARIGAHRLALVLATGINPPGMVAAHGDCHNRWCINPAHLSWKTQKQNQSDRLRDGTNGKKLTIADVQSIRESAEPRKTVAGRFGVSVDMIQKIQSGKAWVQP